MSNVGRRLGFAVLLTAAAAAAFPLAALADPSPSPSLDTILAPAPAAYTAPVNTHTSGNFTAADYATTWGSDAAGRAQSELEKDGFVAGFGVAKADTASGRFMIEYAMAFTGQSGALRFMGSDQVENQSDSHYVHADTAAGIGSYYFGVHEAQASPVIVLDAFEFVKGNDLFGVGFASSHDDVLALATAQAAKQFDAAPAATIPPGDWPENQAPPNSGGVFTDLGPGVVIGAAVIVLLFGAAVFVWMRRNELKPVVPPPPTQELTADGKFWWNGTYWIATSEMAPPWAQRSPDGAFWWDGHAWQPVPRPVSPAMR